MHKYRNNLSTDNVCINPFKTPMLITYNTLNYICLKICIFVRFLQYVCNPIENIKNFPGRTIINCNIAIDIEDNIC